MITISLPRPPIGTATRRLYSIVPATLDTTTLELIPEHIDLVAEFPVETDPSTSGQCSGESPK